MSDAGRWVGATALVAVIAAVPAWIVHAQKAGSSALALPLASGACVEAPAKMRRNHPVLLAEWRKAVVRSGARIANDSQGRPLGMGLEAACLGCHGSAQAFCDKCHAEAGVSVSCWGCHSTTPP